jgi:hypothetical protein
MDRTGSCPGCRQVFEFESAIEIEEVKFLRAATGWLILQNIESPLHMCDSLTKDDERELLELAIIQFNLDSP